MDISGFDSWLRSFLEINALAKIDDSLNGIQVSRSSGAIERVAFAVDASRETMQRAVNEGAQVLMVHHGLFWGGPSRIEGALRERLALLLENDLALVACHLPLDKHPDYGNNAVLARMLGLSNLEPFGLYHGVSLGFKGDLNPAVDLEEAIRRVLPNGDRPRVILPFGPKEIRRAAVVSGGAAMEAFQAIDAKVDLYITGEASHSIYHQVLEAGMHFVAAGHYATETWGLRAIAEKFALETGLSALFLDVPTGL